MRIAAFVLSLIGGIIGLLGSIGGLGLAGLASGLGDTATQSQMADAGALILVGFIASIVNLIAGSAVLARKAPRKWGVANIVASVIGIATAGGFYLFGGLLALVAGLLSLFVRSSEAPLTI